MNAARTAKARLRRLAWVTVDRRPKLLTVIHNPCKTIFQELLATDLQRSKTDGKPHVARAPAAPFCGYDFGNRFCSLFLLWEICVICGAISSPNSKNKFRKHSKKLNRKVSSKPSGSSLRRRPRTSRS